MFGRTTPVLMCASSPASASGLGVVESKAGLTPASAEDGINRVIAGELKIFHCPLCSIPMTRPDRLHDWAEADEDQDDNAQSDAPGNDSEELEEDEADPCFSCWPPQDGAKGNSECLIHLATLIGITHKQAVAENHRS
ncbi:hypothetical protein FB451DRAFT_1176474 [Mycena latifolia]|nr:hypothetical protein FB451DRAFT_1176474 [Mycena latifolia]